MIHIFPNFKANKIRTRNCSESRLAEGKRFIPVGMEINSGDELVICCEKFEILRKMNDALPDVNGIR